MFRFHGAHGNMLVGAGSEVWESYHGIGAVSAHVLQQGGPLGRGPCPFLEASWEMLHHNPSILYFKRASIGLQAGLDPLCMPRACLTHSAIISGQPSNSRKELGRTQDPILPCAARINRADVRCAPNTLL